MPSASCTVSAAETASAAIANAAQKASPTVLKTYPFALTIPSRISSSCRASAVRIVSGCASHNLVLPSMSVNRKVTVPVGASNSVEPIERMAVGIGFTRREAHSARRARHTQPARSPRDGNRPVAIAKVKRHRVAMGSVGLVGVASYSGDNSPEPPISFGMSRILGSPSLIGSTLS
jgi:hypothetical protein